MRRFAGISRPNLVFWGDSLTASAGATGFSTRYPYLVANSYASPRWFWQGGVGGQTSTQIGTRQGNVATTATISGGQIPASGDVTVTFPSGYEPVTDQGPTAGVLGSISGIPGRLTLSGAIYTFSRTTAGNAAVVASAAFIPDVNFETAGTQIIWAGRNNYSNGVQVQSDIAAMVGNSRRNLVLNVLTSSNDGNPSTAYTQITNLNAALAATYGSQCLDVLGMLVGQGAPGAPYADPTAYAGGYPPSGLRSDTVHLNDAGYALVAAMVDAALVARGW